MKQRTEGNALITIIIFTAISIAVIGASVALMISNTQAASAVSLSEKAYMMAESGAENALLTLLRDRTYTGETLNMDEGTVEVSVTGESDKIIRSSASFQTYVRTVEVLVQINNNRLDIIDWKEVN